MNQKTIRNIFAALAITAFIACENKKEKTSENAATATKESAPKENPDSTWKKAVETCLDRDMAFINFYNLVHYHGKLPKPLVSGCDSIIEQITNANATPPMQHPLAKDVENFKTLRNKVSALALQLLDFYQQHPELKKVESAEKFEAELVKQEALVKNTSIEYHQ